MVSKSISTSVKLSKVSDFAALLFTWMIPHTDDYGRMDGSSLAVRGIVVPMRDKKDEDIKKALGELSKEDLIKVYVVNDRVYLQIDNFDKHQTLKSDRGRWAGVPSPKGKFGFQRIPKDSKGNQKQYEIYTAEFESIWNEYPNKSNKFTAFRTYQKIKPDKKLREIILKAFAVQKQGRQWNEGFTPHLSTWLSGHRWEDIPEKPRTGGEGTFCEKHQHFIPKGKTCGY